MMAKVLVALRFGVPSSVTATGTLLEVPALAIGARQVESPVAESTLAGPAIFLNVNVCVGTSGSVATLVTLTVTPALMVRSATGASEGAVLPTVRAAMALVA